MRELRRIELFDDLEPQDIDAETSREALSRFVRRVYVACYRRFNPSATGYGSKRMAKWDGGDDQYGVRHSPVWPKVVDFLTLHKCNPHTFVFAQFSEARGVMPTPNKLITGEALARYTRHTENVIPTMTREFRRQAHWLEIRIAELEVVQATPEQKLISAICDEHGLDATPLFRYCMAVKANLPRVADHYYIKALTEYVFQHEHYDTAWTPTVIPAELRAEAQSVLARLTQ